MIYSLSHTDLDGFGAQFVLSKIYKDILYFNADYDEISDVLKTIIEKIKKDDTLIITDLNLNFETASFIEYKRKEIDFELFLIDHHISGEDVSKLYSWYYLNDKICATKLTFEFFKDKLVQKNNNYRKIEKIVDYIDIYDMWRKNDIYKFNKASFLSDLIFLIHVPGFENEFKIRLIENVGELIISNMSLLEIEKEFALVLDKIIKDVYSSMKQIKPLTDIIYDDNYSINTKLYLLSATNILDYKFYEAKVENIKVVFFTNISSSVSQYVFDFMLSNPDYFEEIFERKYQEETSSIKIKKDKRMLQPGNIVLCKVDNKLGTMSFRSRNKSSVKIAKIFGGGGHPDAAGAKLDLSKINNTSIEEIKEIIEKTISKFTDSKGF